MKKKKSEYDLVHATPAQIADTKNEIAVLENMLQADQAGSKRISDINEFKGEIKKKQALLAQYEPKKFRGPKANKAYTEAKKLKAEILKVMPSRKQYFQRYPKDADRHSKQADFENAVKQQMAFQSPEIQQKINRYKHIMRRLDPTDPSIANIENLRR